MHHQVLCVSDRTLVENGLRLWWVNPYPTRFEKELGGLTRFPPYLFLSTNIQKYGSGTCTDQQVGIILPGLIEMAKGTGFALTSNFIATK